MPKPKATAVRFKSGTGIGVGLSINTASSTNKAEIGNSTVNAGGHVKVDAGMKEYLKQTTDIAGNPTTVQDNSNDFSAESVAGASVLKVGVAGALAINVAETDTQATMGASVDGDRRCSGLC